VFDTLEFVIERLYAESMFVEQTFHVKDPLAGLGGRGGATGPASGGGCHTRSSGWRP